MSSYVFPIALITFSLRVEKIQLQTQRANVILLEQNCFKTEAW